MADLSLAQIREIVRTTLDVDEDDLPDLLLDSYVREAFDDIAESQDEWSFYEFEDSFEVVPTQQTYDLATLFGGMPPLRVRSLSDVRCETYQLRPRDHRQMRDTFRVDNAGRPTWYSRWGGQLYLWPIPTSIETITVTGHRDPHDWVSDGAGGIPDMPEPFHLPIAWSTLSQAYFQQDDFEAATLVGQRAENRLRRLRKPYVKGLDAQPLILNNPSGRRDYWRRNGLAFPFDSPPF